THTTHRSDKTHQNFNPRPHSNTQRFKHHKSYYCPRAAIPAGQEEFYKSIQTNLNAIWLRHGAGLDRLVVRPERHGFRVVHVWIDVETYTWSKPIVSNAAN